MPTGSTLVVRATGVPLDVVADAGLVEPAGGSQPASSKGTEERRLVINAAGGATVRAGDRYGVMKFGSRMDIFLPGTAQIVVAVGDTVRGGETVIAVLH